MAWSGGVFSRLISGGWTADKATTPAITAARHDVNDDDLAAGINACVPADGSKAMAGDLNMDSHKVTNLTNGSNAQDAVSLAQMNAAILLAVPTGVILPYGGATAPSGYLMCDGSAVSRTTYATLFAIIGTAYGSGNGSTTFNVPDLRDKVIVGKGTTCTPVGARVGNISHTHTGPSHTHTGPSHTHTGPSHTHQIPYHYHGKGTLAISASGSHSHTGDIAYLQVPGPPASLGSGSFLAQGAGSIDAATHTHSNSNFSGSVGHTGGENGDATMTSGAGGTGATGAGGTGATGASGTGATGATNNLPDSIVSNHIIKT